MSRAPGPARARREPRSGRRRGGGASAPCGATSRSAVPSPSTTWPTAPACGPGPSPSPWPRSRDEGIRHPGPFSAGRAGGRRRPAGDLPPRRPPSTGARGGVVRPAPAAAHPRLQPEAPPPRDRAGHRPRLHALPLPLAARPPRHPATGADGAARRRSSSCRAGRRPPAPGSRSSSGLGSATTGRRCSTSAATPATSSGPARAARTARARHSRGSAAAATAGVATARWREADVDGRRADRRRPREPGPSALPGDADQPLRPGRPRPGCWSPPAAPTPPPSRPSARWPRSSTPSGAGGARFHRELAADTGRPPSRHRGGRCGTASPGACSPPTASMPSARCSTPRQAAALTADRDAGAAAAHPAAPRYRRRPGAGRGPLGPAATRRPVVEEPDELAEAVAEQLLARWGVLFRDLAVREQPGAALARACNGRCAASRPAA